jgi:hypothetical protein
LVSRTQVVLLEERLEVDVGVDAGRFTIARSRVPAASCGSSEVVVASTTTRRTFGCRWPSAVSRRGISHRPVVPITPRRTMPEISPSELATSAESRFELGLDAPGPLDHQLAGLGEAPGGAVDQRRAELALEVGDVGGDVRLHGVQGPGGSGEAVVVGDGGEGGELAEVHRSQ